MAVPIPAPAEPLSWTLTNHAGDYRDELVRLGVTPQAPFDVSRITVQEDGKEVPCQADVLEGTPDAARRADLWVCTTIASRASHAYTVSTGRAPDRTEPRVRVTRDDDAIVLANDLLRVRLPARVGDAPPPPILGLAPFDQKNRWLGGGAWTTALRLTSFDASVVGDGPLFARVRLRYAFEPVPGLDAPYAEVTITLPPGRPYAIVEESHRMAHGDAWSLDLATGWSPKEGLIHAGFRSSGKLEPGRPVDTRLTVPLAPSNRLGPTLVSLLPRWTQHADCGWFFGATDGAALAGAIAARAGRWAWPYDNLIDARADAPGRAALRLPTARGARWWLLLAGGHDLADRAKDMVQRAAMQPLDKLANEYALDWPGQPPGGVRDVFFYDGNLTNPTGGPVRGAGRRLLDDIRKGNLPKGDRALLAEFQMRLDPDWWPGYRNGWSPINPNFNTDFIKIPILQCTGLKDHPDFKRFAKQAEDALRADLDHAVTLPGGAGQECPGYTAHAMGGWFEMADACRDHLGFDPWQWPRLRAAASFLLRTSQPAGDGKRRILPLGDTHPPGPDVAALAERAGVRERIEELETEELPGFGVVFRNRPGTPDETFLAFKAGPNRGHMHGDQLAFHYCAYGRRLAIDHMCSYAPRADQEHMHNRVAFASETWPYANMDGHERLVAFKPGAAADVAVGQVESRRLRRQPRTPQEYVWQARWDRQPLDPPLVYRRTVVFVKRPAGGPGRDYAVVRDEATGPAGLTATCALHVETDRCERRGPRVDFGTMTLFCAEPAGARFERFDWGFEKQGKDGAGYAERTCGARFAAVGLPARFVTVLYPDGKAPPMASFPGGVRVDFGGGETDEIDFANTWFNPVDPAGREHPLVSLRRNGTSVVLLTAGDIDLDRPQGEVGLFIPEAGYDFGPVPGWLERQRAPRGGGGGSPD